MMRHDADEIWDPVALMQSLRSESSLPELSASSLSAQHLALLGPPQAAHGPRQNREATVSVRTAAACRAARRQSISGGERVYNLSQQADQHASSPYSTPELGHRRRSTPAAPLHHSVDLSGGSAALHSTNSGGVAEPTLRESQTKGFQRHLYGPRISSLLQAGTRNVVLPGTHHRLSPSRRHQRKDAFDQLSPHMSGQSLGTGQLSRPRLSLTRAGHGSKDSVDLSLVELASRRSSDPFPTATKLRHRERLIAPQSPAPRCTSPDRIIHHHGKAEVPALPAISKLSAGMDDPERTATSSSMKPSTTRRSRAARNSDPDGLTASREPSPKLLGQFDPRQVPEYIYPRGCMPHVHPPRDRFPFSAWPS